MLDTYLKDDFDLCALELLLECVLGDGGHDKAFWDLAQRLGLTPEGSLDTTNDKTHVVFKVIQNKKSNLNLEEIELVSLTCCHSKSKTSASSIFSKFSSSQAVVVYLLIVCFLGNFT